MRNDSCVFANYCDRYGDNNCQGCMYVSGSISDKAEGLRKRRSNLSNVVRLSDRYKIGWDPYGMRLMCYEDDKKLRKETDMTIKQVYFNEPVTVVLWADGTKTIVKCQEGDTYSKETGLAVAIAKKALGNKGNFNEVFKKWIPEYGKDTVNNVEESAVGYVYFKDGRRERITSHVGDHSDPSGFRFDTRDCSYVAVKQTKCVDAEFREYMDYYVYYEILKRPIMNWDRCRTDTIDRVEFRKDDAN